MLTPKKIRLILIAPALIAIIALSGCFHKKKPDEKATEEIEKTKKDFQTTKPGETKESIIEIEEEEVEESDEDEEEEVEEAETDNEVE